MIACAKPGGRINHNTHGSHLRAARDLRIGIASAERFQVDGFGTFGVVHSDEQRADFVREIFEEEGAGRTRAWSPEVDSRLGLQLSAELSERLDSVVQVLAEQGHDVHYTPSVECANLQYEVTDA